MILNFIKKLDWTVRNLFFFYTYTINKTILNLNAHIRYIISWVNFALFSLLITSAFYHFFNLTNTLNAFSFFTMYTFSVLVLVFALLLHNYYVRHFIIKQKSILGFLLLSLVFFIYCVFTSKNFITLYCGLEGLSLTTLFLLSRNFFKVGAKEVFLKYFCFSTFSSILFLSSISLLYSITFSLDFLVIRLTIFKSLLTVYNAAPIFYVLYHNFFILLTISAILMLFSFFFKVGIFPFHFIIPDLYNQTSTLFLIIYVFLLKPTYILTLTYLFYAIFFDVSSSINSLIILGGFGSILIGTFSALGQLNIFRLMGYSSIIQMGFLLLSFSTNTNNILIMLFFLACYLFTFFVFLASYILLRLSIKNELLLSSTTNYIGEFTCLMKLSSEKRDSFLSEFSYYTSFLGIISSFLSNAALPPFIGFFSKYILILTLVYKENVTFIAIILFLNIVVAYYYIHAAYSFFTQLTHKNYNNNGFFYSSVKHTSLLILHNLNSKAYNVTKVFNLIHIYWLTLFICFPLFFDDLLFTLISVADLLLY